MQISRKTIFYVVGSLLAIIVLILAFQYLNSGVIKINTNSANEIFLLSYKNGVISRKKVGKGNTSLRYSPGKYSIVVQNQSNETQITVDVKRFQQKQYSIELFNSNQDELVTRTNVSSLQATPNNLNFVEETFQDLQSMNLKTKSISNFLKNGTLAKVFKVKWVSENKGIATMVGGYTVMVDPQGSTPIKIPYEDFDDANLNNINIDVLGITNGVAIVRLQDRIYGYDVNKGIFKQIVGGIQDYGKINLIAELSKNYNLSYSIIDHSKNVDVEVNKNDYEITFLDYNSLAKNTIKLDSEINKLLWSGDGKNLLISTNKELYVYNPSSKSKQIVLPYRTGNSNALRWISADSLIYFSDNSLWRYNIMSQKSDRVSTNKNSAFIKESTLSTDEKYYYYVIPTSNSNQTVGSVYRIPIK